MAGDNEDLKELVQSTLRDIMQQAFVKAVFRTDGPALGTSTAGAPAPSGVVLTRAVEHEIEHPTDPSQYMLELKCCCCVKEWHSNYGGGGEPYRKARDSGWSGVCGSWTRHQSAPASRLM